MGCVLRKTQVMEMQKSERVIRATLLIQRWYRKHMAMLEARRRSTWKIFQSIEYAGELDQNKLHGFFEAILYEVNKNETKRSRARAKRLLSFSGHSVDVDVESELLELVNPKHIYVEPDYDGPELRFPLTTNTIHALIEAFKAEKILHAHYLIKLLLEARLLLKLLSNINLASTAISHQITVCGDLHGKLDDLLIIFSKNGLPSVDNPYVFNGDYVDRGPNSIEVFAVLLACFVTSPKSIFLNRGNHEDHIMNCRYGFLKEIANKYPGEKEQVARLTEDVFSWLPLLTIIDEKIIVMHGGISDTTNFTVIKDINRHRFPTILQPPLVEVSERSDTTKDPLEWKQLLDLLWSDPRPQEGCHINTYRGGGCYFGPDITKSWLQERGLRLIIRSHECKQEGFEYTHNDQVLTIFSASNYYEMGSNKGAYIRLVGDSLQHKIVQYVAGEESLKTSASRISQLESAALKDLRGKILSVKSELLKAFAAKDTAKTGLLSVKEWCSVMQTVTGISLPWRRLVTKLTQKDAHDQVDYVATFNDLEIENRFNEKGLSLTELLYKNKDNLETLFHLFDIDNSGYITMDEFIEACKVITRNMPQALTKEQLLSIGRSMDFNKDGNIDFNEFLEAFRIVQHKKR